jgi:signal transduction histidine kinase
MTKLSGLILCLLLAGCWSTQSLPGSDSLLQFTRATAISSDDFSRPPPDSTNWYQIKLPDNWNVSRPDQGGGVWYKIPVDLSEDATQNMGVLLVNYSMNASIWWDNIQIVSGGRMEEPLTRNWHNPLYGSIGLVQAKQGRHWLYIHVRGYANDAAGLGQVYIGPESELSPVYSNLHFVQYTLSTIAFFVMLVLALGALLMWLLRRSETTFLWISIGGFLWMMAICDFIPFNPPFSRFYWEILAHSAINYYVLVLFIIVGRMLGLPQPRAIWSLALLFTAGWAIILFFGEDADLMHWALPMHTVAVMIGIYLCYSCAAHWYHHRQSLALVVSVAMLPQLLFSIHDWWIVYFGNQIEDVLMIQFGPPMTLLILGVWMIYSFSNALQESELHTEHIEAEVERVTASLKEEQVQIVTMQKEHAVSVERERFTRELHDGLGGYLAAISTMLHDGVKDEALLTRTVDQALLDMRLVMDGLGEECNDVGMLMGMLRHRLQQPLQAWGLQVSWNLVGLPMQCSLKDGDAIHLMRIVQEALTNAARHAHADWVEVRASVLNQPNQNQVCIEVIDNGCGWSDAPEQGNGLANMQKRADMMQATLSMKSEPNAGVHISLRVRL